MEWANRMTGTGEEEPDALQMHQLNFRLHPDYQKRVVEESLTEIGWIQPVLVNRRSGEEWPDHERGVLTVIDGHLRVDRARFHKQSPIPVSYVDLNPNEEKLALAVLDNSAAMAQLDALLFQELTEEIETESEVLEQWLNEIADPEFGEESEVDFGGFEGSGNLDRDPDTIKLTVTAPTVKAHEIMRYLDNIPGVVWTRSNSATLTV